MLFAYGLGHERVASGLMLLLLTLLDVINTARHETLWGKTINHA